jgi:hypothetical protein
MTLSVAQFIQWIEKYVEGSVRVLLKVLSRHLPEETQENHEKH